MRQGLTEGILLALAGALLGVGVAALGTRALLKMVFPLVAFVPVDAAPSAAVWFFALGLAVLTGALFSAGPAWALSRTPPLDALSGGSRSVQARSFVPRGSLVVVQVALSLVLLSAAGLLATSLGNLEAQRLGFDPERRLVVRLDPPAALAGDAVRLSGLFARMEEGLRRVAGVQRVAYSLYSPMEGNNWSSRITVSGRRNDPARQDGSSWNRVSAGYFETTGTRVLRGRPIDERDTPAGKRVAVVSETFARRFFERRDPIGQTVGLGGPEHVADFEIVGVVEDVKYTGANRPDVRPMLFLPSFQLAEYAGESGRNVQARSTLPRAVILQTAAGARGIEAAVRRAIAGTDPRLNVTRVVPMPLQVAANFRLERLMARLTSFYGLLALALAVLGLYGVTAYGVAQRTREIGVRMAMGANRAGVLRTCLSGPMVQTGVGLVIGIVGALLVGRAIRTQLYGVAGIDGRVLGIAVAALAVSALVAALLPARRAASLDPAKALRSE